MPTIKFVNEKVEVEVPQGTNLRKAAQQAGVDLYDGLNGFGSSINSVMNCHGFGMCGTCRVLVTKGMENTSPMSTREKVKFKTPIPTPIPDPLPCLAYIGREETMRLACMTQVNGDIEVETRPQLDLFGENFFS
jgi:ferredoxin